MGEVDIGHMRKPYHDANQIFDFDDLSSWEPFGQFKNWFEEASGHPEIYEANAMCLATASSEGLPSARMVLLKKFGPEGFTFFTNYQSNKAKNLDSNPNAALVFYWEKLNKSVRVEGRVVRVSEQESEEYFRSRPISSQIGASISNQSTVIASRAVLDRKEDELRSLGESGEQIPRPDWGGYRVEPAMVEFWKGQTTRIHDRIRFRRPKNGEQINEEMTKHGKDGWLVERLAP